MMLKNTILKCAVAALLAVGAAPVALAQDLDADRSVQTAADAGATASVAEDSDAVTQLLEQLAKPEQPGWAQIEQAVIAEWSKSGSAAMDLLFSRGQKALSAGDMTTAISHFSALIDHAPEFAEGWNARATAFFQADRYGLALSDIERTLALEPRHFGALTGLAIILEQVGYPEDALDAWRAVEAIHPHRPAVKEALERLEKEVGGRRL